MRRVQIRSLRHSPTARNSYELEIALTSIRLTAGDKPGQITFRNSLTTGFSIVALIFLLVFATIASVLLGRYLAPGGYLASPLIFCVLLSLTWVMGITSAVRVGAEGLVVDSGLYRHVIPWERFGGVSIDPRKGMLFSVIGKPPVRSISFGRSNAGAASGYKLMQAKQTEIEEACRKAEAAHEARMPTPEYRAVFHVPVLFPVLVLTWCEVIYWLSYAVQH
jgi:hypothetical protein